MLRNHVSFFLLYSYQEPYRDHERGIGLTVYLVTVAAEKLGGFVRRIITN